MPFSPNDISPHQPPPRSQAEALADLTWLVRMGADEIILETPQDRFAASAAVMAAAPVHRQKTTARTLSSLSPSPASPGPPNAVEIVAPHQPALACQSIAELVVSLEGLACNLRKTASHLCFTGGNWQAPLMIIGDVPGRDEDISGQCFAGASALLLTRMLEAIGLVYERDASLFNFIPWRPPGNRSPTEAEILQCRPYVLRAISLCKPAYILSFGSLPLQSLLGLTGGIFTHRGKVISYSHEGLTVPWITSFPPRQLLTNPAQKRLSWRDLLTLKSVMLPQSLLNKE